MKNRSALSNRITELDLFRGIAVILMIFDHLMFDLWGLFPSVFADYPARNGFWWKVYETAYEYWFWDVRVLVRGVVVFVFLALTGICCSFSRSNVKRAGKLFIVALLMSAVTFAVGYAIGDLDIGILFGVLHCIAVTLFLVGLLEKLRADKLVYLSVGILMLAAGIYLGRSVPYISYGSIPTLQLLWRTVIGTAECGGDSFPLLLCGGQIMIGVFLGKWLYAKRKPLLFKKYKNNLLTFVGRHSLLVYVVHQIAIPVIVGGVMLLCGFKFLM